MAPMLVTNAQITGQTVVRLPNSTNNEICLSLGFFFLVLLIMSAITWTKVAAVLSRRCLCHDVYMGVVPPEENPSVSRHGVPSFVVDDTTKMSEKYASIITNGRV